MRVIAVRIRCGRLLAVIYRFAEFELAPERYELRRAGRGVTIEPRVLEVLAYLVENRGRTVSKADLLDALWPGEFVTESALTRTIRELRKALGDSASDPLFIRTVYGRGFLWVAEVTEAEPASPGAAPSVARGGAVGSPGAVTSTPAPESGSGGPFVGRKRELERLLGALEDSLDGRGRLVMVTGEPGIGKTRTAHALATAAGERGATVLWGRSLEGWRAPPYWPWVQIVRAYLEEVDAGLLGAEMGVGASDIADLVPEIRDQLPGLPPAPALEDPEQARFRLFDSLTRFLRRAAARRPLMLVLDNLHWADKPSLRLLEVLAHELAQSSLLVVGTYRDVELSRRHPLSDTLGELGREGLFERVPLKGLSREEAYSFMAQVAGAEIPPGLSRAVHAQTEGNPFFLTEVARLLVQEGVFSAAVAAPASPERQLVLSIPEGVREVVGRRLNRLSDLCNQVLGVASVVGRAFGLAELEHLLPDVAPRDLLVAAEEAVATGVLQELPGAVGRYQFTHALIRETLYEELSTTRRVQEHRRIAVALEEVYGAAPEAHLPLLAYHFFEAAPAGVAEQAMDYNRRAGRQAMEVFAYEESARFFERALESMELIEPADEHRRCRLLLELGEAWRGAGELREALEVFLRAAANARRHGWSEELAEAALGSQFGLFGAAAVRLLEEALAAIGDEESTLRVRLLSELATAHFLSGGDAKGTALSEEALAMARRLGEPKALYMAFRATIPTFNASAPMSESLRLDELPDDVDDRFAALRGLSEPSFAGAAGWLETSEEMLTLSEQLGETSALVDVHGYRATLFLTLGQVEKLRAEVDGYGQRAARLRQPIYAYLEPLHRANLASMEGRFESAERYILQARSAGHRIRFPNVDGIFGLQMFVLRRLQGRLNEIAGVVEHFVSDRSRGSIWGPGLAVIYADVGDLEQARAVYEPLAANGFLGVPRDVLWMICLAYLSEVAVAIDDPVGAERLFELTIPTRGSAITGGGIASLGSTGRYLGALAATAGAFGEAERHFAAGLEMNQKLGAVPWLALTRQDYARFLLHRAAAGDEDRAADLLREALATAATIGMKGLEASAAAMLDQLGVTPQQAPLADQLSPREIDVLRLLAAGRSNRQIAVELAISLNTVAKHVRNVLAKTRSTNRTEAAGYAIRNGLAETGT